MTKTETFIPVPLIGGATGVNKGALQWKYEKLACLGSGNEVLIVDTKSLEVVQVLTGHSTNVTHALWLPCGRQFVGGESKLSNRDVISVDANYQVIVWDVLKGQQVGTFAHPEGARQIVDIQVPHGSDLWMRTKVYILYAGNLLTVFDYVHGSSQFVPVINPALEGVGFTDHYFRFSSDPYHTNQYTGSLVFLSMAQDVPVISVCKFWDCLKDTKIVIQERLSLDGKASPGGTNSSPISRSISSGSVSSLNQPLDNSKRQIPSSSSIRKLVSDIIVGQDYSLPTTALPQVNGSITFHPGIKDTVVVSTETAIHCVNIHFMTVLHTFNLEKQGAPIVQVIPANSLPCIFSLHENGIIFLRKYGIFGEHSLSFQLETICYNENPRFSGKKTEVIGFVVHPIEENSIIMYLSDGRLLKYVLVGQKKSSTQVEHKQHVTTPATPLVTGFGSDEPPLIPELEPFQPTTHRKPPSPSKHSPTTLSNSVKLITEQEVDSNMTIQLQRITHSFGQFTCLKSRGEILVAGTTAGFVVVLKIVDHRLKAIKKFTTHASSPVSGIEFVSDSEILTYSNLSFSTNPKCELILTEIWTGATRALKMDDNHHIQTCKVSPLAQYFIIVFKNGAGACELWDLPRRQLIKTLPNKLPAITCIHWRQPVEKSKEELFYMTDLGTFLFTFRVEGNRFLNATCVKLEHTAHVSGIPTALFSREDMVFRADSNAVLVMYNTTKKTASPSTSIGRGPLLGVVKVPGEENYILQFVDSLVVWDFVGLKKVKSLHSGHLKTTSIAVLENWVAYIPKGSNGVRLLPLNPGSVTNLTSSPTVSQLEYPYFMNTSEKASKILEVCQRQDSTVIDFLQLSRDFGSKEEYLLWDILYRKWNSKEPFQDVDILCPRQQYKEITVKTAQCVWAIDFQKREQVAKILLWTGESERAAEILLDTEPSDTKSYVLNGLKASISVGSSNLPEQSKAVLKIIATNLIASGDMDGGLELLCLLQKHQEACKYVESTNEWRKAVLLSKTALSEKNAEEFLCRFAQFINSKKCAYKAATIYAYLGKYDRAIEVLFGARLRHLSYLLLHFCIKEGVPISINDHIRTAISLDFARFIFECGLRDLSIKFCESLGEKGSDLKQELEILSS